MYNDSKFLVSFDIVSLFTNLPLDETISIFADFLYRGSTISFFSIGFLFKKTFLFNCWKLPQSQCH